VRDGWRGPPPRRRKAGPDVAKDRPRGGRVLPALAPRPEPMALELGEDVVQALAGDVHLVERLHGGEPRRPAPVGFRRCVAHRRPRGLALGFASERFSRTSASAALAAVAPLSSPSGRARAQAWSSLSTVRMPLPTGLPPVTPISIRARADSPATMS